MPDIGVTNNAESNARRIQALALQISNMFQDLESVLYLRVSGNLDFEAISYQDHPEFGNYDATEFNKCLDMVQEMKDSDTLGRLKVLVKS